MPNSNKVTISEVEFDRSRVEFELHLKKGFTRQELISSLKEHICQNSRKPKVYHVEVFLPNGVELDIVFQDDPKNNWDWTFAGQAINFSSEHLRLFESIPEMHKNLFA